MDKKIISSAFIALSICFGLLISCQDDSGSDETCSQDEICTAKLVTVCCTDDVCVFKYNGKEYADDEEDQLAIDLGCSSYVPKDELFKVDVASLKMRLHELMESVRKEQLSK